VAVGYLALTAATSSRSNITAVGASAGQNGGGNDGTYIGFEAGRFLTTGIGNTFVGKDAGRQVSSGGNNTCLGNGSAPSSNTISNTITLGNSSITTLRCQVTTITALSDERDKTNIKDIPAGLDFINALRPVEFDWNTRDGAKVGQHDMGFIAQQLQQVQQDTGVTVPGLVFDDNPEKLEAGYGALLPVLVKAVQELSAEVAALKSQLKGA
jgi:hypothetical protein